MLSRKLLSLLGSLMLTALLGCAMKSSGHPGNSTSSESSYPSASETPGLASGFGVVEAIDTVSQASAGSVGVGTAASGTSVGQTVESRSHLQSAQVYRVSLRMDNGTVQILLLESAPTLRIGDRVRIGDGIIERM